MLYLLHEAPPEEQNFSMVMEMISAAEVHEDDDNYQSPLDILFERLEMREPDSIACKQYRMVFRSLKISDELAASAIVRGIESPYKKESYYVSRIAALDYFLIVVSVGAAVCCCLL